MVITHYMKHINEFIFEKIKVGKKTNSSIIDKNFIDFDDAIETFSDYFKEEPIKVGWIREIPIRKGFTESIHVNNAMRFNIDIDNNSYSITVAEYDYGLVFLLHIKHSSNSYDMLGNVEVQRHYLYGDNFYDWVIKLNNKYLMAIFNIH